MKKKSTKPAPTRCLWQQGFRDALQRLSVTLMLVMLTATTAWAKLRLRAYTEGELSNAGGTIAFVSDQDHNNIVVTPNQIYYVENVIHEYSQGDATVRQTLTLNYLTGYYEVNSSLDGTVFAYFCLRSKDVCVSFDMNGHPNAANAPAPQDLKLGDKVTRPAPDPIADGYVVAGWYTNAACTTPFDFDTTLDNSLSYVFQKNRLNLTLYARWAKESCTVKFNANGGTGTMDAATERGGTEFVIPTCGFSYDDGYFCAGWATSADGEIVYHPGDKITLTDDLTLYAKWLDVTISGTCGHVNIPTGLTGSEVTWRLTHSEGSAGYDLLTISSINNGWIADYEDGESPWYAYREQIKTIVIGDGVVHIGRRAFKDCTGVNSVSFGNSVNTIYYDAFSNCTSLTSVILPPSMREIYDNAFRNTGLTSVTLNDGLQTIGDCAFYECAGLTSVSIPASVTNIGGYAFHKTSLTSVSIPASVRVIGGSAFQGCSSLQSVTIFAPELDWYMGPAFDNNASGRKIYVFSDCVETYKSEWSKYANAIEAIPALAVRDAGGELGSWCTYYNGMADVTVADGTTVYTAKRNNEGGVTLTATGSNIIKRGEAVLLKSAANVVLSSAASSGDGVYDGNELKGVDNETAQDANTTYYVLSKVNGVFGFYKLKNTVNLGANKAYLAVANAHDAPEFIGFGENTTAINEHEFNESHELSGERYSLDGRKLQGMPTQKGLYIVNGKKIVIK